MAANKERGGKFTSSRDGTCQAAILVRKSDANIFTNKNDRKWQGNLQVQILEVEK